MRFFNRYISLTVLQKYMILYTFWSAVKTLHNGSNGYMNFYKIILVLLRVFADASTIFTPISLQPFVKTTCLYTLFCSLLHRIKAKRKKNSKNNFSCRRVIADVIKIQRQTCLSGFFY